MQPQNLLPTGSSPFNSKPAGGGSPVLLILVLLLGIGTVIFGTLTILFSSKAGTATKTLETQKTAAAAAARKDQKKIDDDNYTKINESPFRSYTAPESDGSFVINFPKNWSIIAEEAGSGTQVNLIMNPDFIRHYNGQAAPIAVRVHFEDRTKDSYMTQYAGNLKSKKLTQADTKVSDQPAFILTGKFTDAKIVREVVVPVRDKVLVFTTQNAQYASEFDQVVSQTKIIP